MSGTDELAVDFAGPEPVTEWHACPVDAQGRSAGAAYTLRHREQDGNAALNDASGTAVATTAGIVEDTELKAWAAGHIRRDTARRPDRRRRAYDVVARIASGPETGSTAGTRKVLALTSAEALAVAWNGWDLRQKLGPEERDVVLAASARKDRHDVSTCCQRVAGARDPGIARPREPARAAGRER